MTVQDVLGWMDGFAPFATQEEYDNCRSALGRPRTHGAKILFALDATQDAVAEAATFRARS